MIRSLKILFALLLVIASCKEVYNPHIQSPETGYLVVEGFINATGVTNIKLTRTTKLVDTASIIYERGAQLFIENDNGESYSMQESDNGMYRSEALNLNSTGKYRLHIKTSNGKEYTSDLTAVTYTPLIDSISWLRDNEGVKIYINSHDDVNNTKYYKWDYTETWEFHSAFLNSLKWAYDATGVLSGISGGSTVDTSIYKCWNTINSSNILIGSTEKLTTNKIYLQLHSVAPASVKISVLYSINIRQHALSHEAYLFYEKLKKNTEQIGSIFDAQPSEINGNIHCINDASEVIIGFVSVNNEQTKRIFISNSEVREWGYRASCSEISIDNIADSIRRYGPGKLPTVSKKYRGRDIIVFGASEPECVDCRLTGSNIRPDFWP